MPGKVKDVRGQRFGRLVAVEFAGMRNGGSVWLCRCDCGATSPVRISCLRSGWTQSCGCLNRERLRANRTKHGLCRTRVYRIWCGVINRCLNKNHPAYEDYGGRGITVAERWREFAKFFEDMGQPPNGCSLDRVDNNKGYSKENCRWATQSQQCRNKRTNHLLTFRGETLPLIDWSERLGLPEARIYGRLKLGWTVEEALTLPLRARASRGGQAQT